MAPSDEATEPQPAAGVKRRLAAPIAAVLGCLLAIGGYQMFYARKIHDYLIDRNHRLLATQSRQIGEVIAGESHMLGVLAQLRDDPRAPWNVGGSGRPLDEALRKLREQYELKLDEAVDCNVDHEAASCRASCAATGPAGAGSAAEGSGGAGLAAATGSREKPAVSICMLPAPEGGYRLEFRDHDKDHHLAASVRLGELLGPLLASRTAFTAVLLVDAEGRVIFQQPEMNLRHLDPLLTGTGGAAPKGDAKAGGEGAGEGFQALLRSFQGASREREVEIRGRGFELFSQPVALPKDVLDAMAAGVEVQENDHQPAPAAAGAHEPTRHQLLLCGLVAKDELRDHSIALSPLVLGAATAVLLLALLCWPLVKLKLLGERQRLRLGDVVMVAVCSLLGVSWLTLGLLGLRQQWRLGRLGDDQLADVATRMTRNLEVEIRRGYAQLVSLEGAAANDADARTASPDDRKRDLRTDLLDADHRGSKSALAPGLLAIYPFAESFTLLDAEGRPALKWTTDNVALAPRSTSRSRDYFRRASRGDLWQLPHARDPFDPGCGDPGGCYVIESVTSQISGVRQAVLAKPVGAKLAGRFAVATLAMPMLSVIRPVLSPEVHFAVIDEHGDVLFHSDPERNRVENLFVETDGDKRLRAAVFARREATLDVSYWGESYRARVAPVDGPPWTVVALRLKGPLEMANYQAMLVCLVFLLIVACVCGVGLVALALLRPGYRPEWLWPSPERSNDYVRLALIYVLLALDLVLALVLLPGSGLLVGVACLLALLAPILGYLQLTRRKLRAPAGAAVTVGLLTLCWLLASLLEPGGAVTSWLPLALILPPVLAAAFLVLRKPEWWRRLTRRRRVTVAWAHPALGVLLLSLLSVLPTLAVWKAATAIAMDCFVKRGQLALASQLEAQRARAERHYDEKWGSCKQILLGLRFGLADAPSTSKSCSAAAAALRGGPAEASGPDAAWGLDFYGGSFFATRLEKSKRLAGQAGDGQPSGPAEDLPEPVEALLPVYSEYAVETRELLHDQAADGTWRWERQDGELALEKKTLRHRLVSLPPASWLTSLPGATASAAAAADAPGHGTVRAGAPFPGAQARPAAAGFSVAGWTATAAAGALFLAVLGGLSWFISRRVFLVDLIEPLWSGGVGAVGSNLFLFNRRRAWLPRDPDSCVRLDCKDLEQQARGWPEKRLELQRSQPGRTALVAGFEHRIFDPEFNDKKLAFLEGLVQDRTVIVLSAVCPDLLLAQASAAGSAAAVAAVAGGGPRPVAAPDSGERWRALLGAFTMIDEDMRPRADDASLANVTVYAWKEMKELLRRVHAEHTPAMRPDRQFRSALLAAECGDNPVLVQFGRELDPFAIGLDRRQLLEELGERAEAYYRSLWATCGEHEKLVLGHLAEDGLINEHDRRWVRRLMARGLIRRDPVFRLMNQTFRRFLLSPACRQEVQKLEQCTAESPWHRFRRPFFATVAAGVVFFLYTQKQLLESALAIAGSVTAALPVMTKALDLVSGRRGGGAGR
jgi:hypothetical protein